MPKAIVSDQDGTLVASEEHWPNIDHTFFGRLIGHHAWKAWRPKWLDMRRHNVQMDDMLTDLVQVHGLAFPTPAIKAAREDAMLDHYRLHLQAMVGAHDLMAQVTERGIPLAIASGMSRRIITSVLEIMGWTPFVHATASAHECARNKPDPGVYLLAAKRLGIEPDECWALENDIEGYRSGIAAGMRAFAIPDTAERAQEFHDAGILITGSLYDVISLLPKLT